MVINDISTIGAPNCKRLNPRNSLSIKLVPTARTNASGGFGLSFPPSPSRLLLDPGWNPGLVVLNSFNFFFLYQTYPLGSLP